MSVWERGSNLVFLIIQRRQEDRQIKAVNSFDSEEWVTETCQRDQRPGN